MGPIEPFKARWKTGEGISTFTFDSFGTINVSYEWMQQFMRYIGWEEVYD